MTTEQQEMLYATTIARDSGFTRVEIAPQDLIALLERIAELERENAESANMFAGERIVSEPGAAIEVTELVLTPEAERRLTITAASLGNVR